MYFLFSVYGILIYAFKIKIQARGGGCGHFIFEGPPGVGKRTMIWAMLREAFGRDTIHVRIMIRFAIFLLIYLKFVLMLLYFSMFFEILRPGRNSRHLT